MFRLFSLVMLSLLIALPLAVHAEPFAVHAVPPGDCGPNVISNAPQCTAKSVFEGKDADMPEGALYQIAIEPARDKSGNLIIPKTIPQALKLMHQMLPHWYLNALRRSRGDYECDVIVDKWSYATLIVAWVRVHWDMDAENSALRQQFSQMGIHHNEEIEQALIFGFCKYIKSDEQKAMETIRARGKTSVRN